MPGEPHDVGKFDIIKTLPLCLVLSPTVQCPGYRVPRQYPKRKKTPVDSNEGRKNRKKPPKNQTGRGNRNQGIKEEWALHGGKTRGEQKPSEKKCDKCRGVVWTAEEHWDWLRWNTTVCSPLLDLERTLQIQA